MMLTFFKKHTAGLIVFLFLFIFLVVFVMILTSRPQEGGFTYLIN